MPSAKRFASSTASSLTFNRATKTIFSSLIYFLLKNHFPAVPILCVLGALAEDKSFLQRRRAAKESS
jgi:hypothetical protein